MGILLRQMTKTVKNPQILKDFGQNFEILLRQLRQIRRIITPLSKSAFSEVIFDKIIVFWLYKIIFSVKHVRFNRILLFGSKNHWFIVYFLHNLGPRFEIKIPHCAEPVMNQAWIKAEPVMNQAWIKAEPVLNQAWINAEPMMNKAWI